MPVADLFRDEKTGRLSSTKTWAHIANVVMTYVVVKQAQTASYELILAYGAIVGGSQLASYWLKLRYRDKKE